MRTVPQAFHSMNMDLELRQDEVSEVSRLSNYLRAGLRDHLPLVRDFPAGSYARNTIIRPLDDIDLVVVLGRDRPADPLTGFSRIHGALATLYPCASIEPQSRCVNIRLDGIGFDLLPAYGADDLFWVWRGAEENWIRTSPEHYRQDLNLACMRSGNKFKPLVKMAKHWNRREGKPLRSFHLEVMASRALRTDPGSYPEGLALLFDKLAQLIDQTCPAPGNIGPAIDDRVTGEERRHARERLLCAVEMARQALQCEKEGRLAEAHQLWRALLGDIYPEPGRQAVDDASRRFG